MKRWARYIFTITPQPHTTPVLPHRWGVACTLTLHPTAPIYRWAQGCGVSLVRTKAMIRLVSETGHAECLLPAECGFGPKTGTLIGVADRTGLKLPPICQIHPTTWGCGVLMPLWGNRRPAENGVFYNYPTGGVALQKPTRSFVITRNFFISLNRASARDSLKPPTAAMAFKSSP